MTVWKDGAFAKEDREHYNRFPNLRRPDQLLGGDKAFWGPPATLLQQKLPELKGHKLISDGRTVPDAAGFGPNNTIWVLDGPEKGIWVLNVSSAEAAEAALKINFPVQDGWYVKIGEIPYPETLFKTGAKKLPAQAGWEIYDTVMGRSLDEINAEAQAAQKRAEAKIAEAKAKRVLSDAEAEAERIKNAPPGSVPTGTPPGTPPPPPPGTWLAPDSTYELVALQGATPQPVDLAARNSRAYQWKLTDDPNQGFRLAGRPGAGPYVSGGQPPSAFGLPTYIVGRAQSGIAGVISNAFLIALFGPDWAKP